MGLFDFECVFFVGFFRVCFCVVFVLLFVLFFVCVFLGGGGWGVGVYGVLLLLG